MSEREWTPSPLLATATSKALTAFARHWPRAMALALDASEAGRAYVADYARALMGCDLAAIPEAAQRWLSENDKPPRPAEFAFLARAVAREMRPPQYGGAVVHGESFAHAQALPLSKQDMAHIDHRSRRAREFLGNWREVGEVWALLWHTADTPEKREQVRKGDVPLDVFDDATDLVLGGVRVKAGPLGGMI